jgi:hypothetical protein
MRHIEIDLDVHRKIEAGRQSFQESENVILRRLLGIDPKVSEERSHVQRTPRSSGAYSTALGDTSIEANSLKELLRRAILVGEKRKPGTIDRLARETTRRGRRVVGRTSGELYPNSPHLAGLAEELTDGWWYDTNVSRKQVLSYLAMLAAALGLPALPEIHKRSEKTSLTLSDLDL